MILNALTLTQPWATLMAAGDKRIETRAWAPGQLQPGQWVAIHAAKHVGRTLDEVEDYCHLCKREPFRTALRGAWQRGLIVGHKGDGHLYPGDLPMGAVVALARFARALPTSSRELLATLNEQERAFGNFAPGRWAWIFSEVLPLTPPVPATGARLLWQWSAGPDTVAKLAHISDQSTRVACE